MAQRNRLRFCERGSRGTLRVGPVASYVEMERCRPFAFCWTTSGHQISCFSLLPSLQWQCIAHLFPPICCGVQSAMRWGCPYYAWTPSCPPLTIRVTVGPTTTPTNVYIHCGYEGWPLGGAWYDVSKQPSSIRRGYHRAIPCDSHAV